MIPKKIHYCWFGGSEMPKEAIKCIDSWKKYCPDYEIIRWDETNYDITKNKYMESAYKEKKWAFVSDYARVDVIYEYGGIYMDTDVELIKPLDDFLKYDLFCGWENRDPLLDKFGEKYDNSVAFGLGYGAIKNHYVLKEILDIYDKISFYKENGELNLLACPAYQTSILKKYGLNTNERTLQQIGNSIIFPEDYFSPKSLLTGEIKITKNTYSIHHFSMSWVDAEYKIMDKMKWKLCKIMKYKSAVALSKFICVPLLLKRKIKNKLGRRK